MHAQRTATFVKSWLNLRNIPHKIIEESAGMIRLTVADMYLYRCEQLIEHTQDNSIVYTDSFRNSGIIHLVLSENENDIYKHDPRTDFQKSLADLGPINEESMDNSIIGKRLDEALDGIGATHQPADILELVKQAMSQLGDSGLQQKLKEAGISARVSKDQQFVTFVKDTDTGPIKLRMIAVQDLADASNLETELLSMLDIADGKAPGATQLKMDALKTAVQQASDVAKHHSAANQMDQEQDELGAPTEKPVADGIPMNPVR